MAVSPLHFVLGLLRQIKSRPEFSQGHAVQYHVSMWSRGGGEVAELKMMVAIQQNLAEARDTIVRSGLTDEAKAGLLSTVDGLINAFSLSQLPSDLRSHISSIDSAITNFAILASAAKVEISEEFTEQRDSFVSELEAFAEQIDAWEIDDRLKEAARKQIALLVALLKNAEAVGVEAALASYWELLIKVKNRSNAVDEKQQKENSRFWDEISSWSERFDSLSKLYDFGQRMLPHLDKFPQITGF